MLLLNEDPGGGLVWSGGGLVWSGLEGVWSGLAWRGSGLVWKGSGLTGGLRTCSLRIDHTLVRLSHQSIDYKYQRNV